MKERTLVRKYFLPAVLASLVLTLGLVWGVDTAKDLPNPDPIYSYQYAAKVVCGCNPGVGAADPVGQTTGPTGPGDLLSAPGQYATIVNIHNPGPKPARVRKGLSLGYPPQEETPGQVSRFITFQLRPYETLKVDCEQMPSEFFPNLPPGGLPFLDGFLVIESDRSLDVVLVSTAAVYEGDPNQACNPSGGVQTKVRSMTVEEVRERRIPD